ncbi:hypothetical protein [Allosphingosinicella sp.]|jgi:hypothetical protein|uniref:COG3904 family protein n=1 Tax=Allosphingosinicella sp. TaxID=2823234 RepID=UPI002F1AA279
MSGSRSRFRLCAFIAAAALSSAQVAQAQIDPDNPTCPENPNWSNYPEMRFTVEEINGERILLAEGRIDDNLIPRLRTALQEHDPAEIWLRSPGGNARVGNEAGQIIRASNIPTRIPAGWACFSACNFLFMGGWARFVDEGGLFIVHMFTHTADRDSIRSEVSRGVDSTIGLIGDIEQQSAILASEDHAFLIRMGISHHLLSEVMYRQRAVAGRGGDRSTRRCLTQAEVRRYHVVSDLMSAPARP